MLNETFNCIAPIAKKYEKFAPGSQLKETPKLGEKSYKNVAENYYKEFEKNFEESYAEMSQTKTTQNCLAEVCLPDISNFNCEI